jgi:hypothetical protein
VNGDMRLAEFTPEFLKHRRKYHERMAKLEKIGGPGRG